jgi:hypothetical protein
MSETKRPAREQSSVARHDDLRRIIADIDDEVALEILALSPTVAEVEEAALWAEGEGDVVDRAGHPLSGTAAKIYDILMQIEDQPER